MKEISKTFYKNSREAFIAYKSIKDAVSSQQVGFTNLFVKLVSPAGNRGWYVTVYSTEGDQGHDELRL